jgi:3-hydroxyethyl bacteriochlorophyllide a dehydrogenase
VETLAVVFEEPGHLTLRSLPLVPMAPDDVRVAMRWSGISTGTEKLLYTGQMPPFPGLGYPLVPGYEGVGEVVEAGPEAGRRVGDLVYVPGSRGFVGARGLFGGQAATVVAPGAKVIPLEGAVGEQGTLLALAATAHHLLGPDPASHPERLPGLIVGHGALGRLLARLVLLYGGAPPVVWEVNPDRLGGATGYEVLHPDADAQRGYRTIAEVSGADGIVDACVARLAPGGEVVLGGFYAEPVRITFPPAFLRRCLRLDMALPDKDTLKDIVKIHLFGPGEKPLAGDLEARIDRIIGDFLKRRDGGSNMELAADQLLNAIYMVLRDVEPEHPQPPDRKTALIDALLRPLSD